MILLFLPLAIASASADTPGKQEMRGVWVSSVVNIDYPSKPSTDQETLKNEALAILDNAADMGLNAVFLQVRPTADALYKSKLFPWSKYLTGSQGLAPSGGFDPLEFWVTEAHKRGMDLHAWINPYRITKRQSGEPAVSLSLLASNNPARLNPGWVVKYSDGNLYFDPGIPEVRKLVIDGILEIIQNYDVDGIHFDDYFYPGKDFKDSATYSKYGKAYSNINDWRRANVNTLIGDLSKAIKATGKNISFGISPFGIWANKSSDPLGSDTKGAESYYDQYADTLKWVKEGLLDYIAPQLYWNIGYSVADYSKLLTWWKNAVSGTGTKLYIGQAAYRAGSANPSSAWYGTSEIIKQLQLNTAAPGVAGSIFFSYKSLVGIPYLGADIKAFYEKKAKAELKISRPSEDITTSFTQFYFNGSSDPQKPLYLNGKPMENRSKQGFFGVLVPLAEGSNTFTFSQEGTSSTRTIYRKTSSSPEEMKTVDIPVSSVFPQVQEYRASGEKITLSCTAPAGSKVTVRLGGKNYAMTSQAKAGSQGLYPATYTYVYTIPSYAGTPRNVDLGTPVYTATYKGTVISRKAPASIGLIIKNSPYYAKVEKPVIDTYKSPEYGNGAAYELYAGMNDYITGMTGSFVRLSSGQWVAKSDVEIYTTANRIQPKITKAAYEAGGKWDRLLLDISSPSSVISSFDGTNLKITVSPASKAVKPVLPRDALFSSVAVSVNNNIVQYTLTVKKDRRIEGYFVEKTPSGAALNVKKPVYAQEGLLPLSGITVMLDPGHGGSETGATGPLGTDYAEKDITLKTALKLQAELQSLGAGVLMTRTTDVTLSLKDRLAASRNAKPDLFMSIHANSMEDNVDISQISGFSAFYREVQAKALTEAVYKNVTGALGRNGKGIEIKNFYVTRGTWTPSILIESGFVPNPGEFEWLTGEKEQAALAKTLAAAIVEYFKLKP